MWNSFRTDALVGLAAEVITFPGGYDDEIHAWVARPTGEGAEGTLPGVVAVHHMPGWDEFYREFSERLARHGYFVICPNLYERFGHGTPDDIAAKARSQGGVPDDSVVADCEAALAWLKAQPVSNGKAGIIGTCSCGRHALLAASSLGAWTRNYGDRSGSSHVELVQDGCPRRPCRGGYYLSRWLRR